jgi:hypothetical protein
LRPVVPLFVGGSFVKGFVAGGCLSALPGANLPPSQADLKRILRRALQGGAALAAGERAAMAYRQGDYSGMLVATAAGAAGVLLIERLLRDAAPPKQENTHGQEA